MARRREELRHFFLQGRTQQERYKSEKGRGGSNKTPPRDRERHAKQLTRQLDAAIRSNEARDEERARRGISADRGIVFEFRSNPGLELAIKSLDNKVQGIELLTVRTREDGQHAAVFVPHHKVDFFRKIVDDYLTKNTAKGQARNQPLVDSITEIRLAMLDSFWTDEDALLPTDDKPTWWEVWLRRETEDADFPEFNRFRREAEGLGVHVSSRKLPFPDRLVTVVRGSLKQLAACTELFGTIAELRKPKITAAPFLGMPAADEAEWTRDLAGRTQRPASTAPAVCVLDTGLDITNPLIATAADPKDLHALVKAWSVEDHHGHGTEMAGLAIFGDLAALLESSERVRLTHGVESVKILPPTGANDPDEYGSLTMEAVARAEVEAPDRPRVVCLAVSSTDGRDRGQPTAWSGALDNLAAGFDEGSPRRLIVVAAGNAREDGIPEYPVSNESDSIHDPGQAWNALTVGAYTDKAVVNDPQFEGWKPVARPGDLCPLSTTSLTWIRKRVGGWPLKPDVVMEGGNWIIDPDRQVERPDELLLLTTRKVVGADGTRRFLTWSADTSAATAQVARMAAIIQANYPGIQPETVRALVVHSAAWTPAMRERYLSAGKLARDYEKLIRCVGFGVPSLRRALWSASDHLTLIVEESIRPFEKPPGKAPTMREMHVHPLPWPREELRKLGAIDVEMRVTLSYFIEASPGRRGWKHRHRYASHGLRFDINGPNETLEQFRHRVNRQAREEEDGRKEEAAEDRWTLGSQLRTRGSIHSDIWKGSAADLAERGFVGVIPVIGWWRERPDQGRVDRSARYSLVVSISTPPIEIDLYQAIEQQLEVEVET